MNFKQPRIKLKPVGIVRSRDAAPLEKKSTRWLPSFERKNNVYKDEVLPMNEEQMRLLQDTERVDTVKQEEKTAFPVIEDPRRSKFSHKKLLVIERISFIMTILVFFLSCLKTEIDILADASRDMPIILMNTISMCIIVLMFLILLRHLCLFELKVDQRKIYFKKDLHKSEWMLTTFFKKSYNIKDMLVEMLIILPHPVSYFDGVSFQLFQTYDELFLTHELNDILSILLLFKVYIIIRSLVNITIYASPSSSRLCHQNGIEHSFLYTVKCILNQEPLSSISVIFVILLLVFGNALKLSEGLLFLHDGNLTGFQKYENCFWCVFITMSTVGYGDYFPKTIPGRITIFTSAIAGVLLSSLLIVSLSSYLEMKPSESMSHLTLIRLGQQAELSREASEALAETIRITSIMKSSSELTDQEKELYEKMNLKKAFVKLKKKIDVVKMRSKEIKSLVDTNNIIEEMNRLFYILKDSLKEIYNNQKEIGDKMERISTTDTNKINFMKGLNKMLSQYA